MTTGEPDRAVSHPGGRRLALVIGTSNYSDPKLAKLRAPGEDAKQLAAALADHHVGQFEVDSLLDAPADMVRRRIAQFCAQGGAHDLALVYLSCHGVLDDRGRLYYATTDTEHDLLSVTAVSAQFLIEHLEDCRSRQQILILDCCHSGAFARGAKGSGDLALRERVEGRGRVVLTASRATEYSFEGDTVHGEGAPSVFTGALVEGLTSGEADHDSNGLITVNELYDYAYHAVKGSDARQNPGIWSYGAEGNLLVAYSPRGAVVEPAPLPEYLKAAIESPGPRVRQGAVAELAELLAGTDEARAVAARERLEHVAAHDIAVVANAARRALDAHPPARPAAASARKTAGPRRRGDSTPYDSRPPAPRTATFERAGELVRLPHEGAVVSVAFSPSGTRIATAGHDGTARVWHAASGQELARIVHRGSVDSVVFSPDGRRLATASYGKAARVCDSASGNELVRCLHDSFVDGVAFGPHGRRIATASHDKTARVWDSVSGQELTRVIHDGRVEGVAFSPDGTKIATASHDHTARVWDSVSGQQLTLVTHDGRVEDVTFSPDGARIATAGHDRTARVWDSVSGQELTRVVHDGRVEGVAFSPDGACIATASHDKTARVWNSVSGEQLARLVHDCQVEGLAFGPEGRRIATASGGSRLGYAIVWGAD